MSISLTPLLLLLLTTLSVFGNERNVVLMEQEVKANSGQTLEAEDTGKLTSCIAIGQEQFYFTWRPRVFKPMTTMSINISIPFVEEFKVGNFCMTLKLKDVDDPLYSDCQLKECYYVLHNFLSKYFGDAFSNFDCPHKKGDTYKGYATTEIGRDFPVAAADYVVKVEVTSKDNTKKILCVEGEISVQDE